MALPKAAFEIFQVLEKSNCRECGEKTCLAFAGAVFLGQRKIYECPKLNRQTVERFARAHDKKNDQEQSPGDRLEKLKSDIAHLDLAEAAERVGAKFSDSGGRELPIYCQHSGASFHADQRQRYE
jgi:Na+-translocating ferredoxin:NAD+ oxidoreductase RNF subunit RnfB